MSRVLCGMADCEYNEDGECGRAVIRIKEYHDWNGGCDEGYQEKEKEE